MVPMVSSAEYAGDSTPTRQTWRWWPPNPSVPDQLLLPDGTIRCADWCEAGDNHPWADSPEEQTCRSAQFRLAPTTGGGRTGHARPAGCQCGTDLDCPDIPSADATLICHGEQYPGEPPSIVLAIDLAGSEHHVHLTLAETDQLTTALHTFGFRLEGVPD